MTQQPKAKRNMDAADMATAAAPAPNERAEFEARFNHLDLTQEPDAWGAPRYKHGAISLAWEAWQAARRAQVVLVPQGMNAPNEWEDIRTLPTCDDLIWLYCQDSNTIDGPIAPEPNLEEYGWSHWAYANAPSTVWIDAAQAKQGGM